MSKKEKYTLLTIRVRIGEYQFTSLSLHTGDFDAEDYVANFYGETEGERDDRGEYYFNGGEVACSIANIDRLTKKEYEVLRKFI